MRKHKSPILFKGKRLSSWSFLFRNIRLDTRCRTIEFDPNRDSIAAIVFYERDPNCLFSERLRSYGSSCRLANAWQCWHTHTHTHAVHLISPPSNSCGNPLASIFLRATSNICRVYAMYTEHFIYLFSFIIHYFILYTIYLLSRDLRSVRRTRKENVVRSV